MRAGLTLTLTPKIKGNYSAYTNNMKQIMSAQKLEAKIIKPPSSVYTGFIYHNPCRSGQYFQLISPSSSSSVLFTGLPSIRAYPRATLLPFFQNSLGLHESQCIQLSPAGMPALAASFGGVPAQDFKTTLPPTTA